MDLQFPSFNLIFIDALFPSLLLLYYYCPPPGRDGSLLKAVDIRGANLFALQEAKFYYNDLHSFQWQHQQHVLQTCTMVHTTTVNVIVLYYLLQYYILGQQTQPRINTTTTSIRSNSTAFSKDRRLVLLLQHKDAFNHNFLSSMDDPFSNLPPYCPASEEWCK